MCIEHPGARRLRRGFTLLEVMIVAAIIAILAAVTVSSYQRAAVKRDLGAAMADLEDGIRQARALAATVGGHAGSVATFNNCTTVDGGAPPGWAPTGSDVAVAINAGVEAAIVPARVIDDLDGTFSTACRLINLAGLNLQGGTYDIVSAAPVDPLVVAFTPVGRAYGAGVNANILNAAANQVRWQFGVVQTGQNEMISGVRILPSGVICRSGVPVPPTAADLCDQNL